MDQQPDRDPDWNLWFGIDPYDFENADWGDPDDPSPDPRMDPVPRAFVDRLRKLIPLWRRLGLNHQLTSGLYDDGHVWVLIPVSDHVGELSLGRIRVDLTDSEWIGSWVVGGNSTSKELEDAEPIGEPDRESFTDPPAGIERATEWMIAQYTRPITRRVWRQLDQVIAQSWTFEDTGKIIAVSGEQQHWSRPETADEAVRVDR